MFFSFSESLRLKELNSQDFGDFFKRHQILFLTIIEDLTLHFTVNIYKVVTYSNSDFISLLSNFLWEFTINSPSHRAMDVLSLSLCVMKK